jgi:SHS2 domain-containing protein
MVKTHRPKIARVAEPPACRVLEHTADLGLCLHGANLPSLFSVGAMALFDRIAGPDRAGRIISTRIAAEGEDRSDLLVNFLRELLYQWNGRRRLLRAVRIVEIGARRVEAETRWVAFAAARHEILGEIKAVTYHQARVERTARGWVATVVLDV